MERVVENVQGTSDRGDDRFGVAIRKGKGPTSRRTFRLTVILSSTQQRFTAPQSGVPIDGDSWHDIGGQLSRREGKP